MRVERLPGGYAVHGDSTTQEACELALGLTGGAVPLIISDPPYGNVLPVGWDRWSGTDDELVVWMLGWTRLWQQNLLPNAAFYVWGGIGTPGFRPFFKYLACLEERTTLKVANLITWKKRRAYGIQHNYLFTREECAYLFNGADTKRPRCFHVPLLEEKRGYAGYDKDHPAKSEFFRRANVWTDITEVMRGKVHEAQKAQRVIEVPIEVHTDPGEWVIDPFAGSGTTALAAARLGRRFVVFERELATFETMVQRILVKAGGSRVPSTDGSDVETTICRSDDDGTVSSNDEPSTCTDKAGVGGRTPTADR